MTKEEAKEALLNFAEENKWKSDWSGFLSGAISTYFKEECNNEILVAIEKFCYKKHWGEFMQRYMDFDRDVNPQKLNCKNNVYIYRTEENGKECVVIEAIDVFRGEETYYTTRPIPLGYFLEYLNDDTYIDKRKERLAAIKDARRKIQEKKTEEAEYKEYLRLKEKYSNALVNEQSEQKEKD